MAHDYVHGYSEREQIRLFDQANTLAELLHCDTRYPAGSLVLEAGCGIGAQTVILARNSPQARFTSIDVSAESLAHAKSRVLRAGVENVVFHEADIFNLPFPPESFDHVFACFVLEHLADPSRALACLRSCLKPGGTLTVIEGDHGSAYFHPDGGNARRAIVCLVDLQSRAGGDALIGRKLYPLLCQGGFSRVCVSPRMVYADASRPELVRGFTRDTFIGMVEGVRAPALELGLMETGDWDKGIEELRRTTADDGVFCYTFFKAVGTTATGLRPATELCTNYMTTPGA
jgi:SAM-dependent methyltransferase